MSPPKPASPAAQENAGAFDRSQARKPPPMVIVTKGWWTLKERRASPDEIEHRAFAERAKA